MVGKEEIDRVVSQLVRRDVFDLPLWRIYCEVEMEVSHPVDHRIVNGLECIVEDIVRTQVYNQIKQSVSVYH